MNGLIVLMGFMIVSFSAYSGSDMIEDNSPKSVIEERLSDEEDADKTPGLISLYRPNYVLPFYYTGSPYQSVYDGNTPNNQRIQPDEFKAQLSFIVPLIRKVVLEKPSALNIAYTQLMYWQFYAKSQYFRETNYEPELFFQSTINPFTEIQLGLNHQSNGRGGDLERSWNRLYAQMALSGVNWYAQLRVWGLIAKAQSSDLHNPNIARYLGYDNILASYQWDRLKLTGQVQNLESGLRRGFIMASASVPIISKLSIYVQFFSGYGQSLIEYNHKTTSFGIGVALNDRIN